MRIKELAVILTRDQNVEGTAGAGAEPLIAEIIAKSAFEEAVKKPAVSDEITDMNGIDLDWMYYSAEDVGNSGLNTVLKWYVALAEETASWKQLAETIGGRTQEKVLQAKLTAELAEILNNDRETINKRKYGIVQFNADDVLSVLCEQYTFPLPPYDEEISGTEEKNTVIPFTSIYIPVFVKGVDNVGSK